MPMGVREVESALIASDGYVALLFTTRTCPTCPVVAARLGELDKAGKLKALICDAERSPDLVSYADVAAVPYLVLFYRADVVKSASGTACLPVLQEFFV